MSKIKVKFNYTVYSGILQFCMFFLSKEQL